MWAKNAGCDGVMLQAYGGYLIDQFMTECWNHRTDEYGGSFENRMRFPLELIADVKKKCGPDYPIMSKITITHYIEGGRTLEEGLKVAKLFEEAGICELQVDHGCIEKWYMPIPTVYQPYGTKLELAAKVKEVVSIPVSCDGHMDDPVLAMKAIAEGKIDYVSLGKQSIADPEWPKKVKAGRFDDIRYCIGCNECLLGILYGRLVQCAVNPTVGFENFTKLQPCTDPKKVLIIGGGVGGMQCAMTAAQRGHDVTIWEKEMKLGGLANAAAAPDFKEPVARYVQYLRNQVMKNPAIKVVCNKEATVENVKAFGPDKVVMASGARVKVAPIPGIVDNPKARVATDYLLNGKKADGKTVVIGGGLVGLETALDIQANGGDACIVEALGKLCNSDVMNLNNELKLYQMIDEYKLPVYLNAAITNVTDDTITIEVDGKKTDLPYDNIIIATGRKANDEIADELQDIYDDNFFLIGDASKPRKILDATHEAYHVANFML